MARAATLVSRTGGPSSTRTEGMRQGGGARSGNDPAHVDRFGAYVARYMARNVVAAGVARRCEIQLSDGVGEE